MVFNVTGVEVAPGIYDPSAMFGMVAVILVVGFVGALIIWIYNNYN